MALHRESTDRTVPHRIMAAFKQPIRPLFRGIALTTLFVDVILCTALVALNRNIFRGDDFTGISWDVDCAHLQHMEGVYWKDGHCFTTGSKSNAAIMSQIVETSLKKKPQETVRPEDIPIDMRPHGLLKGITMKPGQYTNTSLSQTIETWFGEKSGYSNLDFGVRMRHGRLVVPRSGLYQVFSHIYFSEDTDIKKSDNPELEHRMYKFNILNEDSREEELLQAGLTACVQSQKWQPQEENAGSYAGAITHLRAGDEISVRVTYIHLLEGYKGEHYFGLHKIGS